MCVFVKPANDDQWIETYHDENNDTINMVILLILLSLYPIVVQTDLCTLSTCL